MIDIDFEWNDVSPIVPVRIDWEERAKKHAKSGHSIFGCSTFSRLFRCPGSYRLAIINDARSRTSADAIHGSCMHDFAEKLFHWDDEAAWHIGETYTLKKAGKTYEYTVTKEDANYVQAYLDWCRTLPGTHFIEQRLDLSEVIPLPAHFGTCDHLAITARTLTITDLKFGQGVQVFATDNEQLLGYALAAWLAYGWLWPDIERIVLRIAQPRLDHFDTWECDVQYLENFAVRLRNQVLLAMSDCAPVIAGEKQCRFCPMENNCATQTKAIQLILKSEFDDFEAAQQLVTPSALTPDQIASAIEMRDFVRTWLNKVEADAIDRLSKNHRAIPRWKIVEGRSNRKWENEDDAAEFLLEKGLTHEEIYPSKLVSPAQAEELLPKGTRELVNNFAYQPRGGIVLAPESDKRKRYEAAKIEFEDFGDEE